MFIIFLVVWVLLNGQVTPEIAVIGLLLSAALFWFCCCFLHYNVQREVSLYRRAVFMLHYICVLLLEIIKANLDVMHMILTAKYQVEPCLVTLTIPL